MAYQLQFVSPSAFHDGLSSFDVILDTRTESAFAAARVPGAQNACVYQMDFEQVVKELAVPTNARIAIVDSGDGSTGAEEAARRLSAQGYGQYTALLGGMHAWLAAGLQTEGSHGGEVSNSRGTRLELDVEASSYRWIGRNNRGMHRGIIPFAAGYAVVAGGAAGDEATEVTELSLIIDVSGVACDDLTEETGKPILEAHLRSRDFYWADEFRYGRVDLTETSIADASAHGRSNAVITVRQLLRGVPVDFSVPAMIRSDADGTLSVRVRYDYDRVDHGIHYGSGRLYGDLGMHLVDDDVSVDMWAVFRVR